MMGYGFLGIGQMVKLLQQGRGGGYKKFEANCLYPILLVPEGYEYGPNFGVTTITVLALVKRGKDIWRDGWVQNDNDQKQ
jgi:hypothetical protein